MPEFPEQGADRPAKAPFPQQKSGQKGQIIPQPQVAAAEGEATVQPGGEQSGTEEKLRQPGKAAVQGPQGVSGGTKQQACQKAAGDPAPDQDRIHRSSPRLRRGSS